MQRRILGICAIVLLLGGLVVGWLFPTAEITLSFCWRMGAIFAAAWLAYDDVQRMPTWLVIAVPVLLIVLWRSSKLLLIVIPILILVSVVRRLLWPAKHGGGAKK